MRPNRYTGTVSDIASDGRVRLVDVRNVNNGTYFRDHVYVELPEGAPALCLWTQIIFYADVKKYYSLQADCERLGLFNLRVVKKVTKERAS